MEPAWVVATVVALVVVTTLLLWCWSAHIG
jgi:hypothetical protein